MYQIEIEASAQKTLKKLPESIRERIAKYIANLASNPRPAGCKKLKGHNKYRVRVGNYRIIYEIRDDILVVIIIKIGDRKDIYRDI